MTPCSLVEVYRHFGANNCLIFREETVQRTRELYWTDYTMSLPLGRCILQGGSNMTETDLYVNKPHCAAAVDLERVKPQPPFSLLLGLEPVQSCLGVARVMSEQKVPRSVEQRIVIEFLVGENVPSAEIHHRLQQQYGEECLLPHTVVGVCGEFQRTGRFLQRGI